MEKIKLAKISGFNDTPLLLSYDTESKQIIVDKLDAFGTVIDTMEPLHEGYEYDSVDEAARAVRCSYAWTGWNLEELYNA